MVVSVLSYFKGSYSFVLQSNKSKIVLLALLQLISELVK